jgi:hypothetical protein
LIAPQISGAGPVGKQYQLLFNSIFRDPARTVELFIQEPGSPSCRDREVTTKRGSLSSPDARCQRRKHLRYLPSIENARRTLPGMLPSRAYPELTNSIPPTKTAPGPLSDPPVAWTPFTV